MLVVGHIAGVAAILPPSSNVSLPCSDLSPDRVVPMHDAPAPAESVVGPSASGCGGVCACMGDVCIVGFMDGVAGIGRTPGL